MTFQVQVLLVLLLIATSALGSVWDLRKADMFSMAGPRYTPEQWQKVCGRHPWINKYVEWHKANRNSESRYLFYLCHPGKSCGGLGTRVRDIMYLMKLAAKAKRVLIVSSSAPVPLETLLAPSYINWLPNGTAVPPPPANLDEMKGWWAAVEDGTFNCKQDKVIYFTPEVMSSAMLIEGVNVTQHDLRTHCMFTALFTPTPLVSQAMTAQLAALGQDPSLQYSAVHLPMGELDNSMERMMPVLLSSIKCVRGMLHHMNSSIDSAHHKVLLITDQPDVHKFVEQGFFRDVVTPRVTVQQFEWQTSNVTELAEAVAAVGILAHAACLMVGHDNLGAMAMWWGYVPCHRSFISCQRQYWDHAIDTTPRKSAP
ncbi:hypothetical protein V8C86DRAFT_2625865 [Haematococcus lacustris]